MLRGRRDTDSPQPPAEATGRLAKLTEQQRRRLIASDRTDSRIVWWPSVLGRVGDGPVLDYVLEGVVPSRHREIAPSVWAAASPKLPAPAISLAGFRLSPGRTASAA